MVRSEIVDYRALKGLHGGNERVIYQQRLTNLRSGLKDGGRSYHENNEGY